MSMDRHEPFEELISASLRGELTADERARLDAHLDTCDRCRATLAAFADQRRIVAGLRHVAPPAELTARVRTGVEGGSTLGLPWWRRPTTVFAGVGGGLAVVAGALLALVVLNGTPDRGLGQPTPTPAISVAASGTPMASAPAPSATPVESVAPPATPSAEATPVPASPEPDVYLALTGELDNQLITVRDGATGDTVQEVGEPPVGPPIAAELSPDGQWLAHIVQVGESGLNEVRATRIAEPVPAAIPGDPPPIDSPVAAGETVVLGQSVAGSPFLEQLFWSPDSRYLTFTLADERENSTDVWIFAPQVGEPQRLTDVGNAYAGSWVAGGDGSSLLWVSVAGAEPQSYLRMFSDDPGGGIADDGDPADEPADTAENVFQPMVSPNGSLVIYWTGRMEQAGAEWLFSEGAQPWLAANERDGDSGFTFEGARQVFSDLSVGREAFASAAIAWGPDSDAFAVWGVQWTGTSQGPDGVLYPDEADVYFSRATDSRHVTRLHALDDADIPEGLRAIDVKVSPTGRHLVLTIQHPRAGILDPPRADLVLVTRNTGTTADEVETLGSADDGWYGPAAFDALTEAEAP